MANRKRGIYERRTHSGKAVLCEHCNRLIGRGKFKYVYHQEVSDFRGEDVTHVRCPQCIEQHGNPEHEPDYGGVLGADGQVHSDADPGL